MRKLLENKKIANATHNMLAYRIQTGSGVVYQGCDDDGETHAGSRMLHLLQVRQKDWENQSSRGVGFNLLCSLLTVQGTPLPPLHRHTCWVYTYAIERSCLIHIQAPNELSISYTFTYPYLHVYFFNLVCLSVCFSTFSSDTQVLTLWHFGWLSYLIATTMISLFRLSPFTEMSESGWQEKVFLGNPKQS